MLFCFGFALSLAGSLPPGLISLTVAQTAIARGLRPAIAVAAGAAFAEFFQALVAILAADWFRYHPTAQQWLEGLGMLVFLCLGVYFAFLARPHLPQTRPVEVKDLVTSVFRGMVISVFNLLAIPYWFVYCSWLQSNGWWQTGWGVTLLFASGVTAGTMLVLVLYAVLGQWIRAHSSQLALYANRIVGAIFLALGLSTLVKLGFAGFLGF